MSELKIIMMALAVIAGAAWGFYSAGLKSQRDQLAAELAAAHFQAEALGRELELNRQALERRELEKKRLTEERAALAARLEEVYAHDENARAWADAPCPDGVLDCLLDRLPAGSAD